MLDAFKADLPTHSSTQLFRKYILQGPCHVLEDDPHFQLKEQICENFQVEFTNVVLVGSGKLGFSLKSEKRYASFGDESDIDVAVVSAELFEKIWHEVFLFKKSGAYWPKAESFFKYLGNGWIRPDMLPSSKIFKFTADWWHFFNTLSATQKYGPYKIRGGLYHSMFFLTEYQKICIEQCIEENK